ncbi:MAG: TetR/AcrR family transcriptional regulator [Candidatus Thorarchaeota archaeon]
MKQTRARSEEAKTEQIGRIIEVSREIFLKEGFKGFSMRSLANRLGMSQSNIYNYWSSKRELWFDIIKHDFRKFEEELIKIAEEHQANIVELLEKIAKYYFDFAKTNYKRYQMMFVLPPPPSESKGPTELEFEPQTIQFLVRILKHATDTGQLKGVDAEKLALYLWAIVHGTTYVSNSIVFHPGAKIAKFGSVEEFQSYVIELLRHQFSFLVS